jgi:hypothetical protein
VEAEQAVLVEATWGCLDLLELVQGISGSHLMLPKAGLVATSILDLQGFSSTVCLLENIFFKIINSKKMNYFLMFDSVMKNKLKNTFSIRLCHGK